jgi:hypothetical protein
MACNVMYKDRACVDLGSFEKRGRYDQVDTQCVGSHSIFDNGTISIVSIGESHQTTRGTDEHAYNAIVDSGLSFVNCSLFLIILVRPRS